MVRRQIIALSVGASLAIVAGVLAWQGLLPGVSPLKPRTVSQAPLPAKSPAGEPVPAPPSAKPAQVATAVAAKPQPILPAFDTVRVEPSGELVVAGRGEPGAKIDLMAGDKVIGEAQAGDSGDFVIVPPALAPGNYVLALRSHSGAGPAVQSRQTITVSVPAKGEKGVVVALTEPGKASVLLSDPMAKTSAKTAAEPAAGGKPENLAKEEPSAAPNKPPQPASATAPAVPAVAFKTAEAGKGAFYATGLAAPGTHLRIYLEGSHLADVTADADGHWSVTIRKGVTAGHYAVRADAIDATGKVTARAEVPFDVPVTAVEAKLERTAEPAPAKEEGSKSAATALPQATPSSAVVTEIGIATVARGDSLWRISRKTFGRGTRYTLIYAANASQIRDPNLIYPGQVFVLPHADH